MKRIAFLINILALALLAKAQEVKFEWVKNMGGAYYYGFALDASGSIYSTGYFRGKTDFDPSSKTFNLAIKGDVDDEFNGRYYSDIFISKVDSLGKFLWAKRIGGDYNDVGSTIAIDQSGNILVTGYFQGTVDFDPGSKIFNLTAMGDRDIFILKLNNRGDFIWAKKIGGNSDDGGSTIAVDGLQNVIVTGHFKGSVDFDPGIGKFILNANCCSNIFILKLDSNGNFRWAKTLDAHWYDGGFSLAINKTGSIYLTGEASQKIFIAKLDAFGNFLWNKKIEGNFRGHGSSISIDSQDNVYTTGNFEGVADFDPDSLMSFNLSSKNATDIFILKLDSMGNFLWAKQIGDNRFDSGNSIISDAKGDVYITGTFGDSANFKPDTYLKTISKEPYEDMFILKLDPSGNFEWVKNVGGSRDVNGTCIKVDKIGSIFISGFLNGFANFGLGEESIILTTGSESALMNISFIEKLSQPDFNKK